MIKFLRTHKMGVLSALLVIAAALLGADLGFAMAVDPVELAAEPNPSENMNTVDPVTNPGGRPADEALQTDEQGGKTQLQGKAATATDVRDAGLEAEDYDKDVDEFRPFAFPIETYVARQCRPVKANSPEHGHWRTGTTDLNTNYTGSAVTITAGADTASPGAGAPKIYVNATQTLSLAVADFDNPYCLGEWSTVVVRGVAGYKKDANGNQIPDGDLMLFVLNHKDTDEYVKFRVINPPRRVASGGVSAQTITIPANAEFFAYATAGAESQMHVGSETFLPEQFIVYLQKKIETVVITDALEKQIKKVPHTKDRIMAAAEYNFKRKCARSHWNSTMDKFQVYVEETSNREYVYTENGILRQLNMLYTISGVDMTDNDLLAMSTLMFTDNAMTDTATAFCGKKAMQRIIRLVNSADKYKDVGKVEVNNYGIKVRKYIDNFGQFDFVYDPTLNDVGMEEAIVILDLKHATRPYLVNDKKTERDMSKTGEAREAKEYNLVREDCIALNGFNSLLVIPSGMALSSANLGGIQAEFVSVDALPSGADLTPAAKQLRYFLTDEDSTAGFSKNDIVEWDNDLEDWVLFEGLVRERA